jgi:hypothetical protein
MDDPVEREQQVNVAGSEAPPVVWMQRMHMPIPGTPGAPYFDGYNVSKFVRAMEALFRRALVTRDEEKVEYWREYCSEKVGMLVEDMDEYRELSYTRLVRKMKVEYADQDEEQRKSNIQWLQSYKNAADRESRDMSEYIRTYHHVSTTLTKQGVLTEFIQGLWFLEGLSRDVQAEAILKLKVDLRDKDTVCYSELKDFATEFLLVNRTKKQLGIVTGTLGVPESDKNDEISKREMSSSVLVQPNGKYPEFKMTAEPAKTQGRPGKEEAKREDKKKSPVTNEIEALTDRLNRLEINLQQHGPPANQPSRPTVMNPESNTRLPQYGGTRPATYQYAARGGPSGMRSNWIDLSPNQCQYCYEEHPDRRRCPRREDHIRDGLVHYGSDGRICWGPHGQPDEELRFHVQGQSRAQQVEARKREEETVNNVEYSTSSIMLGSVGDADSTDEEYQVQAVRGSGVGRSVPKTVTKKQQERLAEAAKREAAAPCLKTQRYGEYVPQPDRMEVESESSEDDAVKIAKEEQKPAIRSEKVIMTRAEPKQKLANLLKGKVDPKELVDRVLESKVSVTVSELLGTSNSVHKAFFQEYGKGKPKVSFEDDIHEEPSKAQKDSYIVSSITASDNRQGSQVYYALATLMTKVFLGQNQKLVDVLIDDGSEINVMHERIVRKYELPITLDVGGTMKAANKMTMPFAGIADRVPIAVGNLVYEVPFFVVTHRVTHDITLGRPFAHQSSMEQITTDDGAVDVILWNMERTERTRITVFTMSNPRNRTREQVMSTGRVVEMEDNSDEEN